MDKTNKPNPKKETQPEEENRRQREIYLNILKGIILNAEANGYSDSGTEYDTLSVLEEYVLKNEVLNDFVFQKPKVGQLYEKIIKVLNTGNETNRDDQNNDSETDIEGMTKYGYDDTMDRMNEVYVEDDEDRHQQFIARKHNSPKGWNDVAKNKMNHTFEDDWDVYDQGSTQEYKTLFREYRLKNESPKGWNDVAMNKMNHTFLEDDWDGYDQGSTQENKPLFREYRLRNESPKGWNDVAKNKMNQKFVEDDWDGYDQGSTQENKPLFREYRLRNESPKGWNDVAMNKMNHTFVEDDWDGYDQGSTQENKPLFREYRLWNDSPKGGKDDVVDMMRTLTLKDAMNEYAQYSESEDSTSGMTNYVYDYTKDILKDKMDDEATGYDEDSESSIDPEFEKFAIANELTTHTYDFSKTTRWRHRNYLNCAKFIAPTMQSYTRAERKFVREAKGTIADPSSSATGSDADSDWDRIIG